MVQSSIGPINMLIKSIKQKASVQIKGAMLSSKNHVPIIWAVIWLGITAPLIFATALLTACGISQVDKGAPLVQGSFQGLGGRIAFHSEDSIYAINADGTDLMDLTPSQRGARPSWSPDGKHIAFVSGSVEQTNIYVLDMGSSQITKLTNTGATAPQWSPDGTRISYIPWGPNREDIYVMNADGSESRRLTTQGGYESAWSPDGTRIAYECNKQICIVDLNNSHQSELTHNGGSTPSWSPDGRQLAFATSDGVYRMNADGSELTRITNSLSIEGYPVWSPDGKQIIFVGKPQAVFESEEPTGYGLYLVTMDDLSYRRLTREQDVEVTTKPVWSPDGTVIAFAARPSSGKGGSTDIYLVKVDGSAMVRLVADADNPVWQP
jgi:Tol biopolymer transport system component